MKYHHVGSRSLVIVRENEKIEITDDFEARITSGYWIKQYIYF